MKHLLPLVTALCLAAAQHAAAQESPVVVELFTSQGCSSCPPADAILEELAEREDVIALALHVDYWDYIGWEDPFGDPAHAERQRTYAHQAGRKSVYTPEMIVQGQTDIVGAKPMKLSKAIADHSQRPAPAALQIARDGDTLRIEAQARGALTGPVQVHMLRYTPTRTTAIERGENRGKTLTYANIVEGWQVLGQWDGQAPLSMTADVTGDKPLVVILQGAEAGPILAAQRLR
ncbi:DUF1223 domain-containing protein [Sulfitobacter alexandrii]|uniref:DUF1223 domain-containing protein n=1 Tax=Sulfitobacter alexandrii TaxID=1917485 RepID=A0A1J0WI21_9RHOB|nr:DUF1223 domain-containing protein [Sulfitobacter alexandrii]APE43955.1 DUF1223 domain-containing protein [Sulfitobacter alexandrii]